MILFHQLVLLLHKSHSILHGQSCMFYQKEDGCSVFVMKKVYSICNNNYFYNKTTGSKPCHTKSIFNQHGILTVHNLIAKNCLLQMHKVFLNVTPPNITNLFNIINTNKPRRAPIFFEVQYSRLKSSDNLIAHKGPKIYNNIVNEYNKNLCKNELPLQRKFLNSYKASITNHILMAQNQGDETWNDENFKLYCTVK